MGVAVIAVYLNYKSSSEKVALQKEQMGMDVASLK